MLLVYAHHAILYDCTYVLDSVAPVQLPALAFAPGSERGTGLQE